MNLSELEWRARELVGREAADAITDPAHLRSLVNTAYREVLDAFEWSFLKTEETFPTVSGTEAYTLSAPLRYVDTVELGETLVRQRAPHHYEQADSTETGEPVWFVQRRGDEVVFWPTPDDAYTVTVQGFAEPADLTVDGDSPVFRDTYHEGVAYLAASMLLDEVAPEDPRGKTFEVRAGRFVERMRLDYQRRHSSRPMVMGGRALPTYEGR